MINISIIKKKIIFIFEKIIREHFIHFLLLKKVFTPSVKTSNSISISVINTFDVGGGAAKITRQLSEYLKESFPLRLYVKTKKSNVDWVYSIHSKKHSFIEEILRREGIQKGWIEFTGFQALELLNETFFINSSIVHLHNLHGEFFSPILFKPLFTGKKVIWTLHDESFITGHCSCSLGCTRWQIGCGSCPNLSVYPPVNLDQTKEVLKYKKKWITSLQPIVVCPSRWLAERVRIAYPKLKRIEVIANGVDTDNFCPKDKLKIRSLLGLPTDKKVVLFVAEFATDNPFKGGGILREIIMDQAFSKTIFVTVGGNTGVQLPNHICYPYVSNEFDLANLYAACDVMLYPTQADNLPLVVLESMACGTPVIASKLGGIPEIIENEIDGLLVEEYTSAFHFKKTLQSYFMFSSAKQNLLSLNSRLKVSNKFSLQKMNLEYSNLYKLILQL